MKLSATKVLTYLECPRKYWYLYELKLQTTKSEGFFFGSAVHEGLENYYLGKDPMEGVKNALFGKKENLSEEAKEGIDPQKLYNEAKRIFSIYPQQAPYFEPVLVEHFFEVELVHPESQERLPATLTGKIDLVTASGDLVDHKTASGSDTGYFDFQNNFQASAYSYAYWKMFERWPNNFIFNYLIKGNTRREPRMEHKTLKPQLGDACMFFDTCKYVLDAILRGETRDYGKPDCRFCQNMPLK